MSGGAATHSEAVPEWRGLDAQAVAIDVADTRAPFHVVATHQDGRRALVVGCPTRAEAESCVQLLRSLGGDAEIEMNTASAESQS